MLDIKGVGVRGAHHKRFTDKKIKSIKASLKKISSKHDFQSRCKPSLDTPMLDILV